jgi:hypothetical protein
MTPSPNRLVLAGTCQRAGVRLSHVEKTRQKKHLSMKKTVLATVVSLVAASAYALPTYEPFTEYAPVIATSGSNFFVTSSTGASEASVTSGSVLDAIDLTSGLYSAPSGELWTNLNFTGTGSVNFHGLNVYVISNTSIFTASALSSLLPATFPGFPQAGGAITNFVENPAQPLYNGNESNLVGNSAVLQFSCLIFSPSPSKGN